MEAQCRCPIIFKKKSNYVDFSMHYNIYITINLFIAQKLYNQK